MSDQEFAIAYLKAVEKMHMDYFESAGFPIFNCVTITGGEIVRVHVIKDDLPSEIRHDIETMFWLE